MELTFTKVNDVFIAEFTVDGFFNLHVEGGGSVLVYRKTSGENWDFFFRSRGGESVIDNDFAFSVYPKSIRVVCTSKPSLVVLTLADGTQIEADINDGEDGNIPEGYALFYTEEGYRFSASDGEFYVKS